MVEVVGVGSLRVWAVAVNAAATRATAPAIETMATYVRARDMREAQAVCPPMLAGETYWRQSPERRRAMRSAVGGWVMNRLANCTLRPVRGLMMNIDACAG